MIITPRLTFRPNRLLVIGLVLSLMLHLFGGSLWGLFARLVARVTPPSPLLASRRERPAIRSDIVRLERRARAAPAHEQRPLPRRPVAQPKLLPLPVAVAPAAHREIAHLTIRAPHQAAAPRGESLAEAPQRPVAAPPRQPAFSDEQLTQLGAQFAKTIAEAHQDVASTNAQAQTAPATVKHYAMHFNGIHEGVNPGDGEIRWIKRDRVGNTMWYYTHYTYMYGDGHVEEDDIPWPFHYPINDDPFARHDKRVPLEAPPETYKPDRPLKPILMQFFGGSEVR